MKRYGSKHRTVHRSRLSFGWLCFVGGFIVICGFVQMGAKLSARVVAALGACFEGFFAGISMMFQLAAIVIETLWLLASGQQWEALIRLLDTVEILRSLSVG
jgi:hypothetical protein